jgi:hypothetical protein
LDAVTVPPPALGEPAGGDCKNYSPELSPYI